MEARPNMRGSAMYHDTEIIKRVIGAIETGAGSKHFRHGRETMRDDAVKAITEVEGDRERFADAYSPTTEGPITACIAFKDGRAYLAPAGSTLDNPQAWLLVESLAHAADRMGVEWVPRG